MPSRTGALLWLALVALACVRGAVAAYLPILPKEAMFFLWARHGLTSGAPPSILVLGIAASTALFGQSVLAVRLFPVLAGLVGTVAAYRAGWRWTGSLTVARTAALLTTAVPLLAALALLAVPVALVAVSGFFAMDALGSIVRDGRARGWYVLSLAIAAAVWSTPTAVVMVPLIALATLAVPSRRWWRSGHLWAALALLAAVTAPLWWWDMHHGWTLSRLAWGWRPHTRVTPLFNILEFGGEQAAALSPPFAVAAVLALRRRKAGVGRRASGLGTHGIGDAALLPDAGCLVPDARTALPHRWLWLVLVAVPFAAVAVASYRLQTHPEWPLLAYPPLVVIVAAACGAPAGRGGRTTPGLGRPAAVGDKRGRAVRRWVHATLALPVVALVLLPLAVPITTWLIHALRGHPAAQRHVAKVLVARDGLAEMARTFDRHYRALPAPRPFVFGQQAQFTAPLSFHWPDGPYVYDFHPYMRRNLHTGLYTTLWERHAPLVGRDGLFVCDFFSAEQQAGLEGLFDRVATPERFVLRAGGMVVGSYYAVYCTRFRGPPHEAAEDLP